MNKSNKTDNNLSWAAVIFGLSLAFYTVTLSRTVIWGDSAGFALMVNKFILDPAADGHPLYIILGKLFSYLPGELAVNLNFMSAFFAAVGVALVYLIAVELWESPLAAALGAGAFTVSHAFWLNAVTCEVYTINAAFVLGVIYSLVKWKNLRADYLLYIGAFVYGLALSHHLVIGLLGVSILYFLFTYDSKIFTGKRIFIILLCFLLGFSIYIGVFLHWTITIPEKSGEIADIATGRSHKDYMLNFTWMFKNIATYFAYLSYQFPLAGFLLGFVGFYKLFQDNRKLAGFFLLAVFVNAGFFIIGPQTFGGSNYTFYIQDYAIFSIMIAYGCFILIKRRGEQIANLLLLALLLTSLLTYHFTPLIIKGLKIDPLRAGQIPYRDNETFFLNPNKFGYVGPKTYARIVLGQLEPNSIIIVDYTPATVLDYYQQIMGMRPDVTIMYAQNAGSAKDNYDLLPYVEENYGKRPIYVADKGKPSYYNTVNLEKKFNLELHEPIYKVVQK